MASSPKMFYCILEQFNEFQSPLYLIRIDSQKAFDSINRNKMWNVIKTFGLPEKIIRLTQEMYKNYICQVKYNGTLLKPITTVETGVKQGCLLSPILFLMVLDIMTTNATNRKNVT
jgi:hypothetical protein